MEPPDDTPTDDLDSRLREWDRSLWRFLDHIVRPRRDAPRNLRDLLMQQAYAGDIAWEHVVRSPDAVAGLRQLLSDMARDLTTGPQLAGLLLSLDSVSKQATANSTEADFRACTNSAGRILLDRVQRRGRAKPLPSGWTEVCRSTRLSVGSSAVFWAGRMLAAAGEPPGLNLSF